MIASLCIVIKCVYFIALRRVERTFLIMMEFLDLVKFLEDNGYEFFQESRMCNETANVVIRTNSDKTIDDSLILDTMGIIQINFDEYVNDHIRSTLEYGIASACRYVRGTRFVPIAQHLSEQEGLDTQISVLTRTEAKVY